MNNYSEVIITPRLPSACLVFPLFQGREAEPGISAISDLYIASPADGMGPLAHSAPDSDRIQALIQYNI